MTTSARMMFMTGPATKIWKRCHFVFDMNSSGLPSSCTAKSAVPSPPISPAIFT